MRITLTLNNKSHISTWRSNARERYLLRTAGTVIGNYPNSLYG